jgi:glutamate-1-semialdehyde 2,1-aminomutase
MVRFVNSGTEATLSAIRLARGATGRKRIVKVEGGYHGHADSFLVSAGSGVATLGIAGSPGVPDEIAALTTVVPYNDASALEEAFRRFPGEIAAFIVEPLAANMGVVRPRPGYLAAARDITRRNGALLIFDEVISGFRLAPGGAQELYGVSPDLTTLGKILGGGLPVGAYGGPRELMEKMAPVGPVYQAGTLSGNPLAMSAGLAMLREIARRPPYAELERKGALLEALLCERSKSRVSRPGSPWSGKGLC